MEQMIQIQIRQVIGGYIIVANGLKTESGITTSEMVANSTTEVTRIVKQLLTGL